jgi:hypothetical protein
MMVVIGCHPAIEGAEQHKRMGPFLQPKAFFCERVHHALSVSVACRIGIAGKCLLNPKVLPACMKAKAVGWQLLSLIKTKPWFRAPSHNAATDLPYRR